MNVLLYAGEGASPNAIKQTYATLKRLLGQAYDIIKVDAHILKREPWEETCSLLVLPGGRDSPYCQDMNGDINRRIRNYVHGGGRYVGFCAGAYYASASIAFEVGTPMEVKGARELTFYPGASHGAVYPGFVYDSHKGARAVAATVLDTNKSLAMYYNGGGYFVNPERFGEQVQVLATYPALQGDEPSKAAIVRCKVGHGTALLSALHPEYDVSTIQDIHQANDHQQLVSTLTASRPLCLSFLGAQFNDMGLTVCTTSSVSSQDDDAPALTPMYIGTNTKPLADLIVQQLQALADQDVIKDSANQFYLANWNDPTSALHQQWREQLTLTDVTATGTANTTKAKDQPLISLMIQYPPASLLQPPIVPPDTLTPLFNMHAYFAHLAGYRDKEFAGGKWYTFGNAMLYSQVITSTQTVLDKNYSFAQALPSGLVCLATHQVAGRGRGRNSWVSQTGALQFSLEFRHSLQMQQHAPVVFIQYIAALAMVESVRSRPGYENVPLRLKWPNDVYADLPEQGLKKVGGLLVNSSFAGSEFLLVVGCGMNLSNSQPSVCVNDVIAQHDPSLSRLEPEDMLASVLVIFERYYNDFCEKGMGPWFLDQYYKRWLHTDKLVTLTTHDNVKAKIVGITSDYGMLEAINEDDKKTRYTLQPDGNSFDMLKGLIIKKS
ncbi:class II aaRS and biotin synthetase [Hesseltinella vesiculosa]|uniref:Class II aaRS and biotin synthetase n=1 Tax=Hesseltinella vesiculosa TaxID=101127 RepID=A0A1X2GE91_9FUNG|nr:class II aaRS and biotin synthetase [Hesseltinella vesiculosa]